MKHISILDFRKHSKRILDSAKRGERMIMTYRGKPVLRLEPINNKLPTADDPFYQLAQAGQSQGVNMSNTAIDKAVYGI